MELKFVATDRNYSLSEPFNEKDRRITGYGFVQKNKEKIEIFQNVNGKKEYIGVADRFMSSAKEGEGMRFMQIIDKDTSFCETYVWDDKEWYCYVVNNEGKTIDKI